ncbi:4-hydroxybenzoyl-CoA thioesterase [Bacillus cereus]|uniref:acyl-CoA thioesterase n=1 Tax=unclassified Bacillus (in: firmicutes) TaxID=185979 RepID=UPI00047BDB12|nr:MULTISPECIES: thioesterase family protein [unclassified Bacillus (in: firmicutes)]PFD94689.1 4-hydroxybenzoyl-CoA thioesterase [Bacillus sp. AFS023182]PGX95588.1 4-hydroxybenzoyl-CoA thioesterase [Bacillus cereus]
MDYKVKVHWGDTDAAGIVFYPNYYKWMDEATHEIFSSIGHPTDTLFKENIVLPLIETHCNFKQPVLYNTELIVRSKIEFLKEKVFKLSHHFYCEGQLVAEGYEVRAWASTAEERTKAVAIPEHVKKRLLEE